MAFRVPAWPLLLAPLALLGTPYPLRAADDARLSVHTQPPGLEVWLGDRYLGDSPLDNLPLAPGRRTLRIVDAVRHVSASEEVVLEAGQPALVERTLAGRFGALEVSSRPAGAQLTIETPLGATPFSSALMVPGRYRLAIVPHDGLHQPATEEVTVVAGEKVVLDKQLKRRNPFDTNALLRLLLGAGAVGGFVWAIAEQGACERYNERGKDAKADDAATWRTLGIVLGGACTVGFEVVAFF